MGPSPYDLNETEAKQSDRRYRQAISSAIRVSELLVDWFLIESTRESVASSHCMASKANHPGYYVNIIPTELIKCHLYHWLQQEFATAGFKGESYSHYNGHNAIKYLVTVAPCGLIMLISPGYRGRLYYHGFGSFTTCCQEMTWLGVFNQGFIFLEKS